MGASAQMNCVSRLVDAHKYLASCAIGLSGAIFGLIVVDNACSAAQTRSIFGMFTVPAKWYPWALLVFWQLLMPGVSFLGHLGGVLAGQAYVWGWLRWLTISTAAYQVATAFEMESRYCSVATASWNVLSRGKHV